MSALKITLHTVVQTVGDLTLSPELKAQVPRALGALKPEVELARVKKYSRFWKTYKRWQPVNRCSCLNAMRAKD